MMIAFFTLVYALGMRREVCVNEKGHISVVIVDNTLKMPDRETPIVVYGIIASLMATFTALFAFSLRNFTYSYDLTLPFLADLNWHSKNDNEVGLVEFRQEGEDDGKAKDVDSELESM